MTKRRLALLTQVLSIPTMSFHEEGIATFVRWYAANLGLNVVDDRYGNVLVFRGSRPRGVVFNAHMDHPGFEVVRLEKARPVVALWGKVEPKLCTGARLMMYSAEGRFRAHIGSFLKDKRYLGRPLFKLREPLPLARGDFGHFDLPSVRIQGDRLSTRAADNLMSVAAILDMFTQLMRKDVQVQGLFTRGEETGFLGAFGAMESGLIAKGNPLIVLECSSAKHADVRIGSGPVIRVGDWQSSYDPAIDRWVHEIADAHAARSRSKFRYQRQLLPGGRCEACVYIAEGYRAGGIALPLGNYHNHGPRGPAMEYVSVADYNNMVALMCAIASANLPKKNYLREQVAPIKRRYQGLKAKLMASR